MLHYGTVPFHHHASTPLPHLHSLHFPRPVRTQGAAAETIDAALDLINSADATMRMSAAAVLFNVSLYLPKEEGLEMVQLSSGISHRLESQVDDETGCRSPTCAVLLPLLCALCSAHVPAPDPPKRSNSLIHDTREFDLCRGFAVCAASCISSIGI